ncbi:MAG: hypothetical protein M3Q60_10940 [Actinomycetota bacterium]|jgi:uncharacterized membrane protein|nr:hypothetical protein [Actinomycetota bacterium]
MKGFNPNEILMLARVVGGGGMLYLAISIARKVRSRNKASESPDSEALDDLWERFERGEISWDEYKASSRDLEG